MCLTGSGDPEMWNIIYTNFLEGGSKYGDSNKWIKTDNSVSNTQDFMDKLLKKNRNSKLSGDGDSHKNKTVYHACNIEVTMIRTMLVYTALRRNKYKLSNRI